MLNFFRKLKIVDSVPPEDSAPSALRTALSEITFLREQVRILTQALIPVNPPVSQASPQRPMKYDESTKTFIPKTDQEIASDIRGFQELGIL